ncbi:Rieske (2Fe-2S) protein [Streptomyces sp. SKN60]|nr:Rieske (2Fe-2S) protein [Streptomyces sp. SKN60]
MVVTGLVAFAAGAAGATLSGCGGKQGGGSAVQEAAEAAAKNLARLDEVPKDGGLVVDHAKVVLVRGGGDDIKAFSAICTHQGCTVAQVAKGEIHCPCHGSRFDAATGNPVAGPATKPLARVSVRVDNGIVVTG